MKTLTTHSIDFSKLPNFRWNERGYSGFGGELQKLHASIDRMFLGWSAQVEAKEYVFPSYIEAHELLKVGYFNSFPQLVTFATCPSSDTTEEIEDFSQSSLDSAGTLQLATPEPITQVLTPAACYHFYVDLQESTIEAAKYLTTCCKCFRKEKSYSPLQRQWNFSMREIVCVATESEVNDMLTGYKALLEDFFATAKLPVMFQSATDPFFNPKKNPKYIMQKLDPVKSEMIHDGALAVGSINHHRDHFGEAFGIKTKDGNPAFSGCIAFGLERWMYMFLTAYGLEASLYPFDQRTAPSIHVLQNRSPNDAYKQ